MAQGDARPMRGVRQQQEGQLFQSAVPAPQEPSRRAESLLRGRRIAADHDLSHPQERYAVPGSCKGPFRQAPDESQGQPSARPTRQARHRILRELFFCFNRHRHVPATNRNTEEDALEIMRARYTQPEPELQLPSSQLIFLAIMFIEVGALGSLSLRPRWPRPRGGRQGTARRTGVMVGSGYLGARLANMRWRVRRCMLSWRAVS